MLIAAATATLWVAAAGTPAAAMPDAAPSSSGFRLVPVSEGDGKKQPSGAKNKEEAKQDVKSAGSKFKQGLKDMGSGIKNEFGEAKKNLKDPKSSKRKPARSAEGA